MNRANRVSEHDWNEAARASENELQCISSLGSGIIEEKAGNKRYNEETP